jgi:hypothetical protein
MGKVKDLTGQRFGRLVVMSRAESDKHCDSRLTRSPRRRVGEAQARS